MRFFEKKRVVMAAVALIALLAPRSEGTAQDGAVLVTEGVGPRASAGLRRDLSRVWNRPVLALHETGAADAPHFVSVSVRAGQVYVQYRRGSTIRNEQGRAGGRRTLLLQTVMAAVEGTDAETTEPGSAEARVPGPQAAGSATFGTTLIALDVGALATSATSSMRTDDGILLSLVDETTSEAGVTAVAVPRRVRAESASGVMLAIE